MPRTTFTCRACGRRDTQDGAVPECVCAKCLHASAAIANALKSQPRPHAVFTTSVFTREVTGDR